MKQQNKVTRNRTKVQVGGILSARGIPEAAIDEILAAFPLQSVAVILYGSYARGDYSKDSDIDLLAVADIPRPTRAFGRVNVSTYEPRQLGSAGGTLFGTHLARDGVLLYDESGAVARQLASFGDIDLELVWDRVRNLARLLTLPLTEQESRLDGFVRHARYVLRTATYARAYSPGPPCFSVTELSERFEDPELRTLLSSHPSVHGPSTLATLAELRDRIEALLGGIEPIGLDSITDVIVEFDETDLGDAAMLILGNRDGSPYTIIPRVIL